MTDMSSIMRFLALLLCIGFFATSTYAQDFDDDGADVEEAADFDDDGGDDDGDDADGMAVEVDEEEEEEDGGDGDMAGGDDGDGDVAEDEAMEGEGELANSRSPEEINADEMVKRQEKELEGEVLYEEGRQLYVEGKYEEAASRFIAADVKLDEVSRSEPRIKEKKRVLQMILADTYEEWAEDISRQARALAEQDTFDKAIEKYHKAIEKNPSRRVDLLNKIRVLQKQKKLAEFKASTAASQVDPEKAARDRDIDILLGQAKVFFEHRRYSDARELFEQVLLKDPYNLDATRYLRRINERFMAAAEERRLVMEAERVAEIRWKWNDPVTPLVSPEITVTGGGRSVKKRNLENEGLRAKLENIIIPKISFDEATIHSVVKYLKQRSRELDPDGEGVNIFLQLDVGATASADGGADAPEDAVEDEFGEGDFDDEGFDDEVDFDEEGGDEGFADDGGDGGGEAQNDIVITMDFDNIPLGEAIRYICSGAGLKYKVDTHAVIIASQNVPFDEMETRFYPLSAGFLKTKATRSGKSGFGDDDDDDDDEDAGDPTKFFEELGVDFPDGAKINYSPKSSKLIVTNTPGNLRKVEKILQELDESPPQITIEAKFVEISQTDLEELGFDWMFLGSGGDFDSGVDEAHKDLDLGGDAQFRIDRTFGTSQNLTGGLRFTGDSNRILQVNSILGNMQFNTIIRALKQKASTDILSSPKVTTLNGITATIKMVDERFFPESWTEPELQEATASGGTTTGANFKPSTPEFGSAREIGVVLTVTPTVASDRYTINLSLNPSVLEFLGFDDYSYQINLGGINATVPIQMPRISRREVETEVNVWDGETVVLGGMIRETIEEIDDSVPFFGRIPVFGRLFKVKRQNSDKRNLLIFVSARLVNSAGLPVRTADIRGLPDFRR